MSFSGILTIIILAVTTCGGVYLWIRTQINYTRMRKQYTNLIEEYSKLQSNFSTAIKKVSESDREELQNTIREQEGQLKTIKEDVLPNEKQADLNSRSKKLYGLLKKTK